MIKTNNESSMERLTYVAPKTRLVVVRTQGLICDSKDGIDDISGDDVQEQDGWFI